MSECVVCGKYLMSNRGRWQEGQALYARRGTGYARVGTACDSHFAKTTPDSHRRDGALRSTETIRAPRLAGLVRLVLEPESRSDLHRRPSDAWTRWLDDAKARLASELAEGGRDA